MDLPLKKMVMALVWHSSALSAREMGGSLLAESQGEGYGAQFVLTLPITNSSDEQGDIYE